MFLGRKPRRVLTAGGLTILVTGAAALWFVAREQTGLRNAELLARLRTAGELVRVQVRSDWPHGGPTLAATVQALAAGEIDVAVVTLEGVSLGASSGAPEVTALLAAPEVQDALRTGWGQDEHAPVAGARRLRVALRVGDALTPAGIVWLSAPTWEWAAHPEDVVHTLLGAGFIVALVVLALVLLHVRLRRQLFRRVIEAARRLSAGNLPEDFETAGSGELAVLASALNTLRRRLASQVATIDRQRQMLRGLIEQLGEGVIVARDDGRIALVNPTAIRLLQIAVPAGGPAALLDRPVEACIRQHAVQELLLGPRAADDAGADTGSARFTVDGPQGAIHVLARASRLDLAEEGVETGTARGRVVVLTDITEIERTVQLRTDFVANASHELRTPLATIRGAVETLLTLDLAREADAAAPFLQKIDRHSARLQQMVADLLDLSRLESPTERFEPEPLDVRRVGQELHLRFAEALERKGLRWELTVAPEELRAVCANPHLLRLALDNLVDNAIKFTEPGGTVGLRVTPAPGGVAFEVHDTGCGIPEEDQQRVFERFYQVERARSGPERGTGLGLSIVRHAVGAMGGTVRLTSRLGAGTQVTVTVPSPVDAAALET